MKDKVAKRIKNLREVKGISQEEIADRLNISRSAYERMENGKSQSWATHLVSLADFFDVSPEYFVKEESQEQNNDKQNGGIALQNNGTINTINYLSEKLIEQYEKRIQFLEVQLRNK